MLANRRVLNDSTLRTFWTNLAASMLSTLGFFVIVFSTAKDSS